MKCCVHYVIFIGSVSQAYNNRKYIWAVQGQDYSLPWPRTSCEWLSCILGGERQEREDKWGEEEEGRKEGGTDRGTGMKRREEIHLFDYSNNSQLSLHIMLILFLHINQS